MNKENKTTTEQMTIQHEDGGYTLIGTMVPREVGGEPKRVDAGLQLLVDEQEENESTRHLKILDQQPGMVTVQLSYRFTEDLHLQETLAQVSKNGARIAIYDSEKDTQTYTFPAETLDALLQAWSEIKHYWQKAPFSYRHVLLDCGCLVDWDAHNIHMNEVLGCAPDAYLMPVEGDWTQCFQHQEGAHIHRFNVADFCEEPKEGEQAEQNKSSSR